MIRRQNGESTASHAACVHRGFRMRVFGVKRCQEMNMATVLLLKKNHGNPLTRCFVPEPDESHVVPIVVRYCSTIVLM